MNSWKKPACPYRYVVIEGNIGAGKTSLARRIGEDYSAKIIEERFAQNPFLEQFYQHPERYAFSLEMAFLADRYHQMKDEIQTRDMFHDFMIADYYFMKSLIFAQNTLAGDEYRLYANIFHIIHSSLPKPDLYVYLHQDIKQLLWNIQHRGRPYEKEISADYLATVQEGYFDYFRQQDKMRIVVLDTREVDFVHREDDYHKILDRIFGTPYPLGTHRVIMKREP